MEQDGKKDSKYLCRIDVWAMAFGCMVGWGVFAMPGTTLLPVAGPAGTVIVIILGMVIMLVIGYNLAYLMSRSSMTGGIYAYTKEAFGRDHAFISSWFLCLSYLTIVFLNGTALFIVIRILLIANMILTQAGFIVDTAEDGKEAVDKVSEADAGYYDLVLMDIQMPVMDGYMATRAIRELGDKEKSKVSIIAMTANAFKEDKEAAIEAGMQEHIAKPIDVEVMLKTINHVLISNEKGIRNEKI